VLESIAVELSYSLSFRIKPTKHSESLSIPNQESVGLDFDIETVTSGG